MCAVLMEELHRAAFRDQLCNSIFCPSHNLSKLTHKDVSCPSRCAVRDPLVCTKACLPLHS